MLVKNSLLRFPLLICLISSPSFVNAAGETPTSQINNISLPIKSKSEEDFSSTNSASSAQLVRFKLNGSQGPMKMVQIEPEEIVLEGIGEWQESGGIDCDAEMSPPPLNDFSQIIYSILMPIVCLLGSIGALICVFIFTRRQMRSSLSMYLAGLSAFDFVLLLCATIIYPSMNLCLQEGNRGPICHFFWRTSLATYPLSLMAQTASVWTVVAITVDRYLAVRYPLHMRAWCTPHRARTVVFFITVVAVLFKMPSFFEVSLNECGHLMKTTLRDHYLYFTIYYTYGYLLLMLAAPFLFIIVLNARILSIIRTANIQRRQMNVVRRVTRTSRSSSGFTTATALKRGSSGSWVHQHQNILHNGGGNFHPHAAATMSSGGGIIGPHSNNCHMPLYSAIPQAIGNNNHPHHPLHQHGHGSIAGIVGGNFTNSNGSNSNGNAGNGGGNGSNATAECVTMTIDNRCTKMAVMTIAAFIAFNLLAGLNHVIEAFQWVEDDGTNLRIPIGNFLVCLNSATNILIYSIFGRRFRKMFVLQFCPCWRQKYSELNRSTCQNKTEIL